MSNTAVGVDYSYGRPGGAALRADGAAFAVRYLSVDAAKNLTRAEALDLSNNGVAVGVIWETTAMRALDGYAAGVSDASAALSLAHACGMPTGRPIYAAVDFDMQPGQAAQVLDYFRGFASVLSPAETGVYGGFAAVQIVMESGIAHWGWQTSAWSGGAWYDGAQLKQAGGTVTINGVQCDHDMARGDVGCWHPTGSSPAPVTVPPGTYTVEEGNTLSGIAAHLGVGLAALETANPQITDPNLITPGEVLHVPPHSATTGETYTVQEGDSLSKIAAHFGVELFALESANRQIVNPNVIYPGQVIHVP
jgi:LysM repeat protein